MLKGHTAVALIIAAVLPGSHALSASEAEERMVDRVLAYKPKCKKKAMREEERKKSKATAPK